jgi:hypothetical protein
MEFESGGLLKSIISSNKRTLAQYGKSSFVLQTYFLLANNVSNNSSISITA